MALLQLTVHGMKCSGCENTVKQAVGALGGISSVRASHKENRVEVEYDPDKIDPDSIRRTITEQGFTVS
ncbi:MAG TPA: heavy-metal-associated domain-containing protein [Methylococcus sp.]|nr:heavy-metal-associated domain-containing protein [Methylococcus sp.]